MLIGTARAPWVVAVSSSGWSDLALGAAGGVWLRFASLRICGSEGQREEYFTWALYVTDDDLITQQARSGAAGLAVRGSRAGT